MERSSPGNGMLQSPKHRVLLFLVASLLAVFLLAASLSNMQLQAGMPFPGAGETTPGDGGQVTAAPSGPPGFALPLLQGIFALVFVGLIVYVLVRLLSFANLKRLAGAITALVLLFVLLNMLPRVTLGPGAPAIQEPAGSPTLAPAEIPVSPLGTPPAVFMWIVALLLLAGVGAAAITVLRRGPAAAGDKDVLQQEASEAVEALRAGAVFKDVIVRCYMQMTGVLQSEQGIERGRQMTVREFEDLLAARGMPRSPVHQLTALFEKVRYGRQPASEEDRRVGIDSLNEIIQACRRETGGSE